MMLSFMPGSSNGSTRADSDLLKSELIPSAFSRKRARERILLAICVYRTLFVNRSTGPRGRYVFKSRERIMRTGELLVRRLVLGLAAVACGLLPGVHAAEASDNKLALIPGGPHPYFAPWEQAAAD